MPYRLPAGCFCVAVGILLLTVPAFADDDAKTCAGAFGSIAIAACTRAISSHQYSGYNLAILHNDRGMAYQSTGDHDRAIPDFNEAIRLDPKDVLAYYFRGNAYHDKGDDDRAIADYDQAVRLDVKLIFAEFTYNDRGNAYAAKGERSDVLGANGDYDRAIADYSEAIRLGPKNATPYNNRGNVYRHKGDEDRAILDYNEAIRLDLKFKDAYFNRGNAYRTKGAYDRAIADYDDVIRLDPKYAPAYDGRGRAYAGKRDIPRAVADLDEAGNAYKARGDYDHAIVDYGGAISLSPKRIDILSNRGNAYAAKGDLDRAIADFSEAIRLDRNYTFAYASRGNMYLDKGDYIRAIPDYDEAIRLDRKNAFTYYTRGVANLYAGSLPKALADLDQSSALNPKDPFTALWLDIVDKRSNRPGRLAQAMTQLDMTGWPAPLIRLYLGETTPAAVLAAADDAKPETKKAQMCGAYFYTGELTLRRGRKEEAARLFRLAVAGCPTGFIEFVVARSELEMLGAKP